MTTEAQAALDDAVRHHRYEEAACRAAVIARNAGDDAAAWLGEAQVYATLSVAQMIEWTVENRLASMLGHR